MSQIVHDQPCSIMQGAEASLSYCQYYGYGEMNIFNEMLECCGQWSVHRRFISRVINTRLT